MRLFPLSAPQGTGATTALRGEYPHSQFSPLHPVKTHPLIFVVLLGLISIAAIWASFRYDAPIRAAVVASQGKNWKKTDDYQFHSKVRKYGDWPWLMLAGAIGILIAWKFRSREWMRIIAVAMIASTLAGLICNMSRLTTGRTRPRESPKIEQGFYGPWNEGRLLIGQPAYNSFPSGHTATAFGFAGVIFFACPLIGLGALILAALVGCSSIAMGAHHLSDVVVSIIFSLAVSWFVWKWVRQNGDQAWRQLRVKLRRK